MQRAAQVAQPAAGQDFATILADCADRVDTALIVAYDEDRFAGRRRREAVARIGDLLLPADTDPSAREDSLLLEREERRIGVARARQHSGGFVWKFRQDTCDGRHLRHVPQSALNCVATTCS